MPGAEGAPARTVVVGVVVVVGVLVGGVGVVTTGIVPSQALIASTYSPTLA
jgi:hypothetical protein